MQTMSVEDVMNEKGKNENKLQEEYIQSFAQVEEGQMLPGEVVEVANDYVYVDVGLKSEGKILLSEFQESPKPGEIVYVILLKKESRRGEVVVSKQRADEKMFWKNLRRAFDEHTSVSGKIARKIKGGFEVDLGGGIHAFLPLSKTDIVRVKNADEYCGLDSQFYIERLYDRGKTNIVVTRKDWLEDDNKKKRDEFFARAEIGDEIEGVVKSFTSFGAFVDLGGFDGLLHINDMSWGHINSPKDVVSMGDTLKLKLIRVDPEENRINLSLKHFTEDPWTHFESRYQAGDIVKGRVTKLADFGAFIELEEGIEGLVHISELSWVKKVKHPKEILKSCDLVETKILSYDVQQGKLSLGLKQVFPNPWDDIDERFPVGMRLKRRVKNITNFGAFLELEEGIDGLLHIEDMSWTKKIKHPSAMMKVDDEIEVMVIESDKKNRKVKLSSKQLTEDPWKSLGKAFSKGSVIEGEITNITDFGFFVKVQGGIEGLANKANLSDPGTETVEDALAKHKVGEKIRAVILEINPEKQKLSLSIKDYLKKIQKEELVKYIHDESTEEKTTLAEFFKDINKD